MTLKDLAQEIRNCKKCPLSETRTSVVVGRGVVNPEVLFIGEAPGEEEDLQGRPFVGKSGKLLDEAIAANNIRNYAITNICRCRPPNNRKPTPEEVKACKPWLDKQIELLDPKLIVLLGASSLNVFFPEKKITGAVIEFKEANKLFEKDGRKFMPVYHPSYCLRGAIKKDDYIRAFDKVKFFLGDDQVPQEKPSEEPIITKGIPDGIPKEIPLGDAHGQPQPYIPLHCHTENGSTGDVYGTIEEMAQDLKDKGFVACAITDHGSACGWIYFQETMKKYGIKPIIGIEAYLAEEGDKSSHIVLLVKNDVGYKNLLKLIDLSKDHFHRNPRMLLSEICSHHEGLICSTACVSGPLAKRYLNGESIEEIATKLRNAFGDDFYLEVMPNRMPEQRRYNEFLAKYAKENGIKMIITTDSHYRNTEDKRWHDLVKANKFQEQYDPNVGFKSGFGDNTFCNLTASQIDVLLNENHPSLISLKDELFLNTLEVAYKCNFEIPEKFGDTLIGSEEEARKTIESNIDIEAYKKESKHDPLVVDERIKRELDLIYDRGYAKYFATVLDMCKFADKEVIPRGPGRGSVGGSLVAYLLGKTKNAPGITRVDPLRFGTMFERFISATRSPDIDMDFSGLRRDAIIGHLVLLYGRENVAPIITFQVWKDKMALKDVCRIYGVSQGLSNAMAKELATVEEKLKSTDKKDRLIEKAIEESAKFKTFAEKNPQVVEGAIALRGKMRHRGTHAAGIVICDKLRETIPTEYIKNTPVVSWEKKALEKMNIVKFDVLGLEVLDIMDEAIKSAKLNWMKLPEDYNDPKIFEALQSPNTAGIFQFGTNLYTSYIKKLKPTSFDDLVAVNCLCRPGPLNSGMAMEYVERKNGKKWIPYHEILEPITRDTLGIFYTQEQIMQIAYHLGGFTWPEAEKFMKLIAKSQGAEALNKEKGKFFDGAKKEGVNEHDVENIFNKILEFGRYSFNKCLSGDTEITDAETGKIYRVEDLYYKTDLPKVFSIDDKLKLVKQPIKAVHSNGSQTTFTVKTAHGRKISATENHKFLTINGWKPLKELKIGERIAVPRKIPVENSKDESVKDHQLVVLGYVLSEGNTCHPSGFYMFTQNDTQRQEYVESLVKFNNTKPTIKMNMNTPSVYAGRTNHQEPSEAVEWIRSTGLYGKKATKKEIPDLAFGISNDQISLLLAKMWEGDGHISDGEYGVQSIYYATSSPRMAEQVQDLLLRLGIISTVHTKYFNYRGGQKTGYTITVSGEANFRVFYSTVGQHLSTKRDTADKIYNCYNSQTQKENGLKRNGTSDLIPIDILPQIKKEMAIQNKTAKTLAEECNISDRNFGSSKIKKGFRRETVKIIGEKLNSEYLSNLANSDVYWDEIKQIKHKGWEPTYDLEMEENHNYIANNIVVHNSHSVEYSILGYWTTWLKYYYPLQMYSALINAEPDSEKVVDLLKEVQSAGVNLKPPSLKKPSMLTTFDTKEKVIYLGLNKVDGIGPKLAEKIVGCGTNFSKLKKNISESGFKTLVEIGYCDHIEPNRRSLFISKEPKANTLSNWSVDKVTVDDWSEVEKMARLRKHLPWARNADELPKTEFDDKFSNITDILKQGENVDNNPILLRGWILKKDMYNNSWGTTCNLKLEDGTGAMQLNLNADVYSTFKNTVEKISNSEYTNPITCCVQPYYFVKGGTEVRVGKGNVLWIGEMDKNIPSNVINAVDIEITPKKNQYKVINVKYGTSKGGNKYAAVDTIDADGNSKQGVVMIRDNYVPQIGDVVKGSWQKDFFNVE